MQATHLARPPPSDWNAAAMVEEVAREQARLQTVLADYDLPVVFCHNDLQHGNILRRRGSGELMLIDYEYASANYRGFDIGNHFCEWTADYSRDLAHALVMTDYPSAEAQVAFCTAYLEAGDPAFATLPLAKRLAHVHALRHEANALALASHLLWSLWGLIQAAHSTIEFDYLEYSAQRLREYFRRRDTALAALAAAVKHQHHVVHTRPPGRPRRR